MYVAYILYLDLTFMYVACILYIFLIFNRGFVINLILNLTPEASPAMLARANVYQWVIYVSQVNFANKEEVSLNLIHF